MTVRPAQSKLLASQSQFLSPLAKLGLLLAFLGVASSLAISLEVIDDAAVDTGRTAIYRLAPLFFTAGAIPPLIFGLLDRRILSRKLLAGLALCVIICLGSLAYSLGATTGTQGTFMSVGAYMIALVPGAIIGFDARIREKFTRPLVVLAILTGTYALAVMTLHTMGLVLEDYQQVYRSDIIVLLAGPAFLIIRKRWFLGAILLPSLLAYHGYSLGKSTSYMLAVAFIGVYSFKSILNFVNRLLSNQSSSRRFAMMLLFSPFIVAVAGGVLSLFYLVATERLGRDRFDVRKIALEYRWEQFLDSPLFGQGFVMSANMAKVMGFGKFVPSHNDIADLLAGGGLIAIVLFFMALIPALANREVFNQLMGRSRVFSVSMYFWCNLVFYVAGATGNPLLNRPNYAIIVWFSVGYMLSYARSVALAKQVAAREAGRATKPRLAPTSALHPARRLTR